MLEILDSVISQLADMIDSSSRQWSSLIINRRKPFTYRLFTDYEDIYRVCFHRFEVCDEQESLLHPHSWPGAFMILKGSYLMQVGRSKDRESQPEMIMKTVITPGSRYEIVDPLTWHSVTPLEECYTVMVNGPPWPSDVAHRDVRTTAGKGLNSMSQGEIDDMFDVVYEELRKFRKRN